MSGIERIANERRRQIEMEGYTELHDDCHQDCSLAMVAALYATPKILFAKATFANQITFYDPWPWAVRFDKRSYLDSGNIVQANDLLPVAERIRQLEKAGALITAEIDRLLRVEKL